MGIATGTDDRQWEAVVIGSDMGCGSLENQHHLPGAAGVQR